MYDITPSERKANEQRRSAPQKCINFVLQYSKSLHVDKMDERDVFIHLNWIGFEIKSPLETEGFFYAL